MYQGNMFPYQCIMFMDFIHQSDINSNIKSI